MSKAKVYTALETLAGQHGINTKNPGGELYPVDDGEEHMGHETPEHYRTMGDLHVVQEDRGRKPGMRVDVSTGNLSDDQADRANVFQGKIEHAMKAAGMSIESTPGTRITNPSTRAHFPEGADKDAVRAKLVEELERAISKPGADTTHATAKQAGAVGKSTHKQV